MHFNFAQKFNKSAKHSLDKDYFKTYVPPLIFESIYPFPRGALKFFASLRIRYSGIYFAF